MCRSCDEGGRRCELTRGQLDAHNDRRRRARALRSALASWAKANGLDDVTVSVLAVAAPGVAREWAAAVGAPSSIVGLSTAPPVDELLAEADVDRGPRSPRTRPPVRMSWVNWATPSLINAIAGVGRHQRGTAEGRALLDDEIESVDWIDEPGVNEIRVVIFTNGAHAFHKSFAGIDEECEEEYNHDERLQPVHEVAASVLARGLGQRWAKLVPTCVLRTLEGRLGSLSEAAAGKPGPFTTANPGELDDAGFFDALIGQQDRHRGNLLMDGKDLRLIDHGFAFARPDDPYNMSVLQRHRFTHSPELRPHERQALDALLESKTLHGMREILQPARADALAYRAELMLDSGTVLREGEF